MITKLNPNLEGLITPEQKKQLLSCQRSVIFNHHYLCSVKGKSVRIVMQLPLNMGGYRVRIFFLKRLLGKLDVYINNDIENILLELAELDKLHIHTSLFSEISFSKKRIKLFLNLKFLTIEEHNRVIKSALKILRCDDNSLFFDDAKKDYKWSEVTDVNAPSTLVINFNQKSVTSVKMFFEKQDFIKPFVGYLQEDLEAISILNVFKKFNIEISGIGLDILNYKIKLYFNIHTENKFIAIKNIIPELYKVLNTSEEYQDIIRKSLVIAFVDIVAIGVDLNAPTSVLKVYFFEKQTSQCNIQDQEVRLENNYSKFFKEFNFKNGFYHYFLKESQGISLRKIIDNEKWSNTLVEKDKFEAFQFTEWSVNVDKNTKYEIDINQVPSIYIAQIEGCLVDLIQYLDIKSVSAWNGASSFYWHWDGPMNGDIFALIYLTDYKKWPKEYGAGFKTGILDSNTDQVQETGVFYPDNGRVIIGNNLNQNLVHKVIPYSSDAFDSRVNRFTILVSLEFKK